VPVKFECMHGRAVLRVYVN